MSGISAVKLLHANSPLLIDALAKSTAKTSSHSTCIALSQSSFGRGSRQSTLKSNAVLPKVLYNLARYA